MVISVLSSFCTLSGSDQRRSQRRPWSGTSVGLMILLICSMDWRSGLRPPWQQKIFSSTMAATGRQLKQSVNVFHSFMLYLRLPEGTKSYCKISISGFSLDLVIGTKNHSLLSQYCHEVDISIVELEV